MVKTSSRLLFLNISDSCLICICMIIMKDKHMSSIDLTYSMQIPVVLSQYCNNVGYYQFILVYFSLRSRNLQCQRIFQVNAPINCVCLHPNQVCDRLMYVCHFRE